MQLKNYQKETLSALKTYLDAARLGDPKKAFDDCLLSEGKQRKDSYNPLQEPLEAVPYVCLRLPTGGGKTILASHTIHIAARSYLEQDFPVVLWMVPTNIIRQQAVKALKNPHHPYRQAIDEQFDGRVSVYDVSDLEQLRPQDLTERVCVVVATLATLRVTSTEGRHFYAHKEAFEPHFSKINPNTPGLERIEGGKDAGKIKFSFANLLYMHRPLVLIDEAHNAISKLTYEVWPRVNPGCAIEFTATPVTNNVLHRVSAAQLKAEEMIKLPIMLTEHQNWQEAIHDAVLTRGKLQEAADDDIDYIRPIVLFQAESKEKEVTVEVLKKHLIDNENIPETNIAIATGSQRELDGINLFDPKCEIKFVITMEALKEGWDCPFAYVFCSVANIHSSKDVEQFLGRVLRMPYAKKRSNEVLNRAYANVSAAGFAQAARFLHDRLVEKMGFDEVEAQEFLQHQEPLFKPETPATKKVEPLVLTFQDEPDFKSVPASVAEQIKVVQEESGEFKVTVSGEITEDVEESLVKSVGTKELKNIKKIIQTHKYYQQRTKSPSEKGVEFKVPRLCLRVQDDLELVEKDLILDLNSWNLTDYPAQLLESEFAIKSTATTFEIDLKGEKLVYGLVDDSKQLDLLHVNTEWADTQLVRVFDKELRQPDIKQETMLEFLRRVVEYMIEKRRIDLNTLVRFKYPLIKVLNQKIKTYRQQAYESGYQDTLFAPTAAVETSYDYAFSYEKDTYAPNSYYSGKYQFKKHYYSLLGDLKNKGEEFECAQALDGLPQVKHWVRNLERQPHTAFWLQTATDKFYPDFVAKLNDGRIFVVEYKGDAYVTNDDSKEKKALGELWESKSSGKGLFLMAEKKDSQGLNVFDQLMLKSS